MNKTTIDLLNMLCADPRVNSIAVDYDGWVYFYSVYGHPSYRARSRWGTITLESYDSTPYEWGWFYEATYSFAEFDKWLGNA